MANIGLSFLALFLVFVNAFFVAAEFGMVKLRNTQVMVLKNGYGLRGRILFEIHKHLDAYLSACQLGITLASLGLGWIGEPALAHLLEPVFKWSGITSPELIRFISFTVAFSILSYLHIVLGELMPKSMAIRQPESISIWTSVPLYSFYWIMYPAIWFLNSSSNFLLKLTKLDLTPHQQHFYSTEEIKLILGSSHSHGELTQDETEIIEHTLEFADLDVTEVMRPRDELVAFNIKEPVTQIIKQAIKYRYSRYPIYNEHIQNIIGILLVKDLFAAYYQHGKFLNLSSLIRPLLKVPDSLPALELLKRFRSGTSHFCLVAREDESIIGFITLDNLLQIMLGKIKDEFHRTKVDWQKNSDGSLIVAGDCSIYSIERALNLEIYTSESENFTTITGLIFHHLNRFPKEGERIEFENFAVVVLKISGAKIESVKIIPI